MTFRRGFKTEADQIATEVRTELGLGSSDPLDPVALAAFIGIPILPLSSLSQNAHQSVVLLSGSESAAFSAATVFDGSRRLIVHNDSHLLGRQRANLSHELAHGLLLHTPTQALDDHGCRRWEPSVEDEANWLAGALLVTPQAALEVARSNLPLDDAAARYGVSVALMRWRLNVTGAYRRTKRWAS